MLFKAHLSYIIPQVYFHGRSTSLLNVCFVPFRFIYVYNYWNLWVPSCNTLSSVVDICSIFICSLVLFPRRENWAVEGFFYLVDWLGCFFFFSAFVETSRMCWYGFTLAIMITKKMHPVTGIDVSEDFMGLQLPEEHFDLHKPGFNLN